MSQAQAAARRYVEAKGAVLSAGFGWEILWQQRRDRATLAEPEFLREAAWVILSAGMSESVVRARFARISACFLDWSSATAIAAEADACMAGALQVFAHRRKVQAIAEVARILSRRGFPAIARELAIDAVSALRQFPYIGPVTVFHLAKNLGCGTPKPDRHLSRLAAQLGYPCADALCAEIAAFVGDPPDVVDTVLWRHAAMRRARIGTGPAVAVA